MGKQLDIPIEKLPAVDIEPATTPYSYTKETDLFASSNSKMVFPPPFLGVWLAGNDLELFWQTLS